MPITRCYHVSSSHFPKPLSQSRPAVPRGVKPAERSSSTCKEGTETTSRSAITVL